MAVYRILLKVAALNGAVFGLLFIVLPDLTVGLFGGRLDAFGSLIVRQFGGVIAGIAIVDWMLRSIEADDVRIAVVAANVTAFTVVALAAAYAAASGIANPLAWVVAIFHSVVAVGLLATRSAAPPRLEEHVRNG